MDLETIENTLDFVCKNVDSDRENALKESLKVELFSRQSKNEHALARSLLLSSRIYFRNNKFDSSLEKSLEALTYFSSWDLQNEKAEALDLIARCQYQYGDYAECLKNAFDALNISHDTKNKVLEAICCNTIGNSYHNLYESENALYYFDLALKLKDELNDKKGRSTVLINLGNVYFFKEDYKKADEYYIQALEIREELNDSRGMLICYNNLGNVQIDYYKNFEKGLEYYYKSLEIAKKFNYENHGAEILYLIAEHYFLRDEFDKSLNILKECDEIAVKNNYKPVISNVYQLYSKVYKATKEFEKACKYYDKSLDLITETYKETSNAKIEYLNVRQKVKLAKQESEILDLKNKELKEVNENLLELNVENLHNEILLKGVNSSSQILLSKVNFENAIDSVLKVILDATKTDAVKIYENGINDLRLIFAKKKFERRKKESDFSEDIITYSGNGIQRWHSILSVNKIIKGCVKDFSKIEARFLESRKILSILIIPIFVENNFWGFIEFDDCTNNRVWTNNEENILSNIANSIGNYIGKRKIELDLIIAKQNAEEAAIEKSRFLSTMSHEIRTPMNAVIGYSYLLIQENPLPHQLEYLKPLQFSANHLLALINDILDYSKIEAGKIEFEFIEFDLHETVDGIIKIFALKASENNINLKLIYPDDLQPVLIGDTVRLNQILTNLMSNAIKFTSEGGVTLELIKKSESKESVEVVFNIKDTGIGIPQDKLSSVFESFTQANSDTTRKFGGTGLGLAICKRLVEMLGGEIGIESEVGKGTNFFFNLKFKKGEAKKLKNVNTTENNLKFEPLTGVKILIVEDNPVNAILAAKFLQKWEVQTDKAENGLIAVEKVQQDKFDLILMDLQMPEMNGYEAAAAIRNLDGDYYKKIPIIALSAEVTNEIKKEVLANGMNDSVTKPFNPKDLYSAIKNLLPHK